MALLNPRLHVHNFQLIESFFTILTRILCFILYNKDDNIHKKRSSKIMIVFQEKNTVKQCHIISINIGKIGKSSHLVNHETL